MPQHKQKQAPLQAFPRSFPEGCSFERPATAGGLPAGRRTTPADARPEGLGRGGHGGGGRVDLAAAAEALGIPQDELRTRTQAGQTLADVAAAQGVAEADLVDALVAAARTRLADAVAAGRLTRAEADARSADLETRIAGSLDELCGPGGGGAGGRGPRSDDATPGRADAEQPAVGGDEPGRLSRPVRQA